MPVYDGLMRIFWPTDLRKSERTGVVVGWRNSGMDVFVVAVLDHVNSAQVELALQNGTLLRNPPHSTERLHELCGHGSLRVLGISNARSPIAVDPCWVRITIGPTSKVPKVTCALASSIQIILHERPQPLRMQFVSLSPIPLALEDNETSPQDDSEIRPDAGDDRQERARRECDRMLRSKLQYHLIFRRQPSEKEKALPKIVNQMNWAREVEQLLQKNVSLIGARPKRAMSVSELVVESATTMRRFVNLQIRTLWMLYVFPIISQALVVMLVGHRVAAEMLLYVLEWKAGPRKLALKDVSATAQQVEIRLQQFCYWPIQFIMLRKRKNDWGSVTNSHPDYIRFYNSLWLVANDIIIGSALGLYIIERADWVAQGISDVLSTYTVQALQRSISWLMGWPAGLKLNSELAMFLGDLFLWVIEYWSSCLEILRPSLPNVIWFIGFASFAGASMPLAMFSDMLSALTIHIYCFYLASARIYHWQLTILRSLFHLFRGKKQNVLRNRIDSCDYDLDQLLVGTIFFTLLFFLLPTVVVFYLNFAVAWIAIISVKASFDTLLSCLNHFPLFAIMLRVKDPKRLPGGIRFELRDNPESKYTNIDPSNCGLPTSIIYLKSTPLSMQAIFYQYFHMAQRIRKHYLSPRMLHCLLTGKPVPAIDRKNLYSLQYSMLPSRRSPVVDLWKALRSMAPPVPWARRPAPAHVANGKRHHRRIGATRRRPVE